MNFHQKILVIAIVVYSITAFFSTGYFHADEHYQIIEFAGILNGTNEPADMAWEYHQRIRPAIQPFVAYGVFRICDIFAITNPYSKAFVLRLLTMFFSLSAIYFFANSCKKIIAYRYWKTYIVLSYFLWFLPFLNVRFSSETWSGIFLLITLSLVLRNRNSFFDYILIGTISGLSFIFRYQMGFALMGLIMWMIFIEKEKLYNIGVIILSISIVVLLGVALDSLYYGRFTITPLNYLISNLIDGKAASFGTSPWYYYFFFIFRYSFYPIGVLLLLSFIIVVAKRYNSLVVWTIIPFFIAHSFIAHKEFRFLFPLINLVPLMLITAFDSISSAVWIKKHRKSFIGFLTIIMIINTITLLVASIKPAGVGRIKITEEIHKHNQKEKLYVIYTEGNNPYSPWTITTNFYSENNAIFIEANKLTDESIDMKSEIVFVFTKKEANNPLSIKVIDELNLKEVCKSVPDFTIPLLKLYGYRTKDIIILYSN